MDDLALVPALFHVALGLGLAASCGFRIFVPPLVMGVAARMGHLDLGGGFEWIGSTPALVLFGAATLLEVGAYYVPWVDNLLDTVAAPSAVVAGVLVSASQLTELDPLLGWTVSIVAGGGAAGAVQGVTTVARGVSSLATGGIGNPVLATGEFAASALTAILAITLPFVALALLLVGLSVAARKLVELRRTRRLPA